MLRSSITRGRWDSMLQGKWPEGIASISGYFLVPERIVKGISGDIVVPGGDVLLTIGPPRS